MQPTVAKSFNGWPMNFWGWGFEDREAGRRALLGGSHAFVPTIGDWHGTSVFPADKKSHFKKGASPSAEFNYMRFMEPKTQGGFNDVDGAVTLSWNDKRDRVEVHFKGDWGSEAKGPSGMCPSPSGEKKIFMTFDDGPCFDGKEWDSVAPHGSVSLDMEHKFLDDLAALNATVTVFFLGARAETHKELVQEYAKRGHTICLHGDQHLNLGKISFEQGRAEILSGHQKLSAALGRPVNCYRPAYLELPEPLRTWAIVEMRLHIVGLSHDSEDWSYSPTTPCHPECTFNANNTLNLKAWPFDKLEGKGEVVLMHDRPETMASLPAVIRAKQAECPSCQFLGLAGHFHDCEPLVQWRPPPLATLTYEVQPAQTINHAVNVFV